MIFLDTSAIYALADEADPNHKRAKTLFAQALKEDILIHNYVLAESAALLQNRLGLSQALQFLKESENFYIHFVTRQDHKKGIELLGRRGRRALSLVDCVSFIIMRRHRVKRVLAFDPDLTIRTYFKPNDGERYFRRQGRR